VASLSPDERPVLICRLEVPPHMQADVDDWMPKHFDDSLDHEAVTSAAAYKVIQDFNPDTGLPWTFNGHGNRFIVYVASGMSELLDWLDGPILRQAIEDGVERESAYPLLDGDPFTGNVYEVETVLSPLGVDIPAQACFVAERFEVGSEDLEEFDEWLNRSYAPAWADLAPALRVRTFRQNASLPARFPFSRYSSKGNRMVVAEFALGTDMRSLLREPRTLEIVGESLVWDVRLPYVRRECGECIALRDKDDARSTYADRRGA